MGVKMSIVSDRLNEKKIEAQRIREQKEFKEDCLTYNICPKCGKDLIKHEIKHPILNIIFNGRDFRDWEKECPIHGVMDHGCYNSIL